jgi:hypothetical protein
MSGRSLTTDDLLKRVSLNQNLEESIKAVLKHYQIGTLASVNPTCWSRRNECDH